MWRDENTTNSGGADTSGGDSRGDLVAGPSTTLLFRSHHCFADGASLTSLLVPPKPHSPPPL